MQRIMGIAACTVVVLSLILTPLSVSSYELTYTDAGDVVRWFESCVFYSVHEAGAPGIDIKLIRQAIREAFDEWEVPCSYLYFEETDLATCDEVGFNEKQGNMNLIVWATDEWESLDSEHDPRQLALTSMLWNEDTGQMLDVDIEFNSTNPEYQFGVDGSPNLYDIQNIATHEIGHLVGLQHTPNPESTMYAESLIGQTSKRTLSEDDIDGICALYPFPSDPDVCKMPICGLDLDCSTTSCAEELTPDFLQNSDGCTVGLPASRDGVRPIDLLFGGLLF